MEEEYVTIKDAMRLTGYSLRQIDRYIKNGILEVIDPQKHQPRKISKASINAFNDERGYRPVDLVDTLKQEVKQVQEKLAAQEQVNGKLTLEDAELRNLITKVLARVEVLEATFRSMAGQRSRGSAAGLPDGMDMLVDFAKAHAISVGKLRTLAEHEPTLATILERPEAVRMKRKWLISLTQKANMIVALQTKGIAYTPCAHCPHTTPGTPVELLKEKSLAH